MTIAHRDALSQPARIAAELIEAYGAIHRRLSSKSVIPTADKLMKTAQRQTTLAHFGNQHFRQGLDALIGAYRQEGALTWLGEVAVRQRLLLALRTRLLVANELAVHPEIRTMPLSRPLVIASLPRTGTTFLHRVLACDPASRSLKTWEALAPARRPKDVARGQDNRQRSLWILRLLANAVQMLAPEYRRIHSLQIDAPEEELALLENSFVCDLICLPTYRQWYLANAEELLPASYSDLVDQLRLVTWLNGCDGHWLLKTPSHLYGLDHLFTHLPDARMVQVHREPLEVLASMVRMARSVRSVLAPQRLDDVESECVEWLVGAIQRFLAVRARATEIAYFDVRYEALIADPWSIVCAIYARFGIDRMPAFDVSAARFLATDRARNRSIGPRRAMATHHPLSREAAHVFEQYRAQFELPAPNEVL